MTAYELKMQNFFVKIETNTAKEIYPEVVYLLCLLLLLLLLSRPVQGPTELPPENIRDLPGG